MDRVVLGYDYAAAGVFRLASGFCELVEEKAAELGNVKGSTKQLSESKKSLSSGGKSPKKFGKNKKK